MITAIVPYDWTHDIDDIREALDREWIALAEDIGWELVNLMPLAAIREILGHETHWTYRQILVWVLGHKGKRMIPLLRKLMDDTSHEVAFAASEWIEYYQPTSVTPRVIYLPAPSAQPRLPGF